MPTSVFGETESVFKLQSDLLVAPVVITGDAPAAGEVLVATSATEAQWGSAGVVALTATAITDNTGGTANGTLAALGAITTLTDNTGLSGTHSDTLAATAAPTTLTDSTGLSGSHDDTLAAITNSMAGYVYYQNIVAASTSGGGDQLDIAAAIGGETVANLVQPDVPRNIVINFTDGDASITAFQVDVVGTAPDGSAVNEQFLFAGGLDQNGVKVFAKITSVTLTSVAGNGAADTLDIGYGTAIGVPVPAGATGLGIVKLVSNASEEAASATDTTNNSFTPTSAPNGTNDYEVWFEYSHPALAVLAQNVSDLGQKVIELVTLVAVIAQNVSNNGQKIIELVTDMATAKNNFADLAAKYNTLRNDLAS